MYCSRLPIDETDVAYILEDLHRGRSLIPPHPVPNKYVLTRWDPSTPLSVENCVVLDASEHRRHAEGLAKGLRPEEVWGAEVMALADGRMKEAAVWRERSMQ